VGEQDKDTVRQRFLESTGVQFLRFRNVDIQENLRGVLEAIYAKIEELGKAMSPLPLGGSDIPRRLQDHLTSLH
jgi:very-short-patch-repair endonuclease